MRLLFPAQLQSTRLTLLLLLTPLATSCLRTPAPSASPASVCAILQPWSMNKAAVAAMDDQGILWAQHYKDSYAKLCP